MLDENIQGQVRIFPHLVPRWNYHKDLFETEGVQKGLSLEKIFLEPETPPVGLLLGSCCTFGTSRV